MSWRSRLLAWLGAAAFLALAGCCGGGSTHRCDFSPATNPKDASASDGGIPCPNEPCKAPQVCCVTKAPLAASCVDITAFATNHCEMFNTSDPPPCLVPSDCGSGNVCCYQITLQLVSCQSALACPGDGTDNYRTCGSDLDCAPRTCNLVTVNPDTGAPLGFCAGS